MALPENWSRFSSAWTGRRPMTSPVAVTFCCARNKLSVRMNALLGSIPATIAGCPISAWFWQMWDTAGLTLCLCRAP
jgi:hypothetical protein